MPATIFLASATLRWPALVIATMRARRSPAAGDRRARIVAVTKAGRRKVAQAKEIVARIQAEVLESLPARERETFLAALALLVDARLSEPAACSSSVRRRAPRAP